MGILDLFKPNVEKMEKNRDVTGLIKALKHKDYDVRKEAEKALGRIGEPAVESLIQALRDENPYVQGGAIWALREIGDARAVQPLIQVLKHEVDDVRWRAAFALGEIRDARAVEPLIQALKDEKSSVRYEAARALRKIKDARAVEPLIQALKDENSIRHEAAHALGEIGDARAVKPLIQALTDEYRNLIIEAVRVFGKITERANFRDAKVVETLTFLLEALKDKEIRVQLEAVEALVQIKHPDVDTLKGKLFWFREMQGFLEKIRLRDGGFRHISEFADKLWCPHCGKPNKTEEWPINGDRVPFYFQKELGNHNVKVQCPHCNKEWYIVWDDYPGLVKRLGDFV